MSSDNFYFTHGADVYMGFGSDYDADQLGDYLTVIIESRTPVYSGTDESDARYWAQREYSEYGYFGEYRELLGVDNVDFLEFDPDLIYDGHVGEWEEEDW